MAPLLAHDSAVACLAVLQNHSLQQISSSPSSQTISLQSTAVLTLGLLSNPHAPAPCHSFVLEDFSVWFSELLHLKICSQMHPLGELSQCPPTPCPPTLQLSCPPQYFFFVFIFCQRTPIRLGRGLQGSAAWSSTLLFQSWASQTTFLGPQFPHQ